MTKRVKFTDTGTTTTPGAHPIYDVTFDGQPFGQVWPLWNRRDGVTGWVAFLLEHEEDGCRGPNRGRAVAALLVKVHGLKWREAFDAAGVR